MFSRTLERLSWSLKEVFRATFKGELKEEIGDGVSTGRRVSSLKTWSYLVSQTIEFEGDIHETL